MKKYIYTPIYTKVYKNIQDRGEDVLEIHLLMSIFMLVLTQEATMVISFIRECTLKLIRLFLASMTWTACSKE